LSTATLHHRTTGPRRITVPAVRAVLEEVVAQYPNRIDRRAIDDLPARYIDRGQPNCLVALVLTRLGFSPGVLRALDQEHPTGSLVDAGAKVAESRHPALRKLHTDARLLLQYVQDHQDRGEQWSRIVVDAFKPRTWFTRRFDEARRPWLYQ
jgi:hypothetical protein